MAQQLPSRQSSGAQLNSFNLFMRAQPWYQEWFTQRGLNQNRVKLTDNQRHELEGVLAQHGFSVQGTDGMNVDPAGNLNTPHGFASQPTWLKAIEIGAPIAAGVALTGGAGLPGVTSLFGGGGTTAATAGTTAATTGGATAAGVGGTAAATGGGLSLSSYLTRAIPSLAQAGLGIFSANKQASSNQAAIDAQTKANEAALEYAKQKDAQDRADFIAAQRANYDQYVAREQRFAPYRAAGQAATQTIAHLLGLPNVSVAPPPPLPSYLQDQNTMAPILAR